MSIDSRLPGFHRLTVPARIDALVEAGFVGVREGEALKRGQPLVSLETADKMIENVFGLFALPFAVAPNFRINGTDRLVPMVVEEPSIVAGLSSAAKLVRAAGGFTAGARESLLAGQIQLVDLADPDDAIRTLSENSEALTTTANALLPKLVARGGGCRSIEFHKVALDGGRSTVVAHVHVDTCDAMGANAVNTLCEQLAPSLAELVGGRPFLRILSNLADRSVFVAKVKIPVSVLGRGGHTGEAVRDGIVLATQTANASPHRAATHNKGIMNGVDAVAIATGNDWRAIEAGAHAFAVRDGAYRSLTSWSAEGEHLVGEIRIPLKVGTVGGSLRANPGAALGLAIAGIGSAAELGAMLASVGLAQNLAALRALVTDGIQRGHMRMHARSVASTAGVPERYFQAVVKGMIASGEVKVWKAKELHAALVAQERRSLTAVDSAQESGSGAAAGKVILLGEHAVVYGHQALALPLPQAVVATVTATAERSRVTLVERGVEHTLDPVAQDGLAAVLRLIAEKLNVADRPFRLKVESRIPLARGLGGSAAVAVAIIRAFDDLLSLKLDARAVDALAFECEKLAHGTPSGIDNNLATYGQPVLYSKGTSFRTKPIALSEPPPIVVAASGVRGSTQAQVSGVRQRREASRALYDTIFEEMGEVSAAGAVALRAADYDRLGVLMNVCHGLLSAIEVSHPALESMVHIARNEGAVGAKLTGAGGGGSIVALCPGREDAVAGALKAAGYIIIRLHR